MSFLGGGARVRVRRSPETQRSTVSDPELPNDLNASTAWTWNMRGRAETTA